MEAGIIGMIAIGLVVLVTSLMIIKSLGYEVQINFVKRMKETLSNLYSQVLGREYYNPCEAYNESYISFTDFEILLNAFYNKQCEDSRINVILSFSLTENDIKQISENLGIAKDGKMIIYGLAEPVGVGAIIVEGNLSDKARFPFKANDVVEIWMVGSPEKDVLMNLTGVDYNVYDGTFSERPIEYDEWDCGILRNKNRGDECDCNANCRVGLVCDKDGGDPKTDDDIIGHCCPKGRSWDSVTGSCEFKYPFRILFMQLNDTVVGDTIDEHKFRDIVENTKNLWLKITPMKECSENMREIVITNIKCSIPPQQQLCDGVDSIAEETFNNIMSCAANWGFETLYTRIVGILPRENVCEIPGVGSAQGYTGGYNYPVVIGNVPGTNEPEGVGCHELGHTFGLCDEGYGGGYCTEDAEGKICLSGYCTPNGGLECGASIYEGDRYISECCTNRPQHDSIMCKKLRDDPCEHDCTYDPQFASYSYEHLEKELSMYCE